MIKNLVFDFGKVLVDYNFEKVIRDFFHEGEHLQEYCEIVLNDEFMNRCDLGIEPLEDILRKEKEAHPHLATQLQLFHDRFDEFILGEMEGMRSLLTQLKSKGFHLYGLTNWSQKVYDIMPKYEIFTLLDGWVISSEEKLIKPDVAIYHRLCEKFGLRPEECFFTDDKSVNIDGALNAGMKAAIFTTTVQYVADLCHEIPDLDIRL